VHNSTSGDNKENGMKDEPDYTLIANRIRILALHCKNRDTLSCEFGNEFAPKVEDYLRECFEDDED
jgi:hypothetical protein